MSMSFFWLVLTTTLTAGTAPPLPAADRDNVLSLREGRLFLDGAPFVEISFNKFDLVWQLYDELAAGRGLDDDNPRLLAQERALADLRALGFRTIRFFALPWGPAGPAAYADAEKRQRLYAALDRALELCDRHDLRVVWSLGAAAFTDAQLLPGKGWVYGEEHQRELMANPDSRSRALLYRYLDETVARYRNRRAVLMWEVSNETTLSADIGDRQRVYKGQRMPTLEDVAAFWDDVARRIKRVDPLRLVNSGGSHLRESQWHLFQRQGWHKDSRGEQFRCLELLYGRSAVDVIDIHYYPQNRPGYPIRGDDGGEAFLDVRGYSELAARLKKPLMIGEFAALPVAKTDEELWRQTPDYFESYAEAAVARPWVQKMLDAVVDAGVPLSYWWCYQSDRPVDQKNPQRYDIDRRRNPELVALVVAANKRLKAKLTPASP